ncbi:type II toxin-antitoxin system RelE/ParE family toxin [Stutzerimonas xanthomarina]|uniref:type II toxin-antitoxin system RelE/ParE family toxin n=1 Tax=Stutzerimonas xanthomarina TaxID=271420 RepID=UPI003AA869DA
MARIELAPELIDDIDRIILHLTENEVPHPEARIHEIISAIDVLQQNPLIGRPVIEKNRELVIGRGTHGYIALYRHLEQIDTVFVLAIRAQREAGYR